MKWIISQKKMEPFQFIGNVFVMAVMEVMVMTASLFISCAFAAKGTDWYGKALQQHVENEVFLQEKAGSVFAVLGVGVLFVIVYVVVSVWLLRTMQLNRKRDVYRIYFALGYERGSVKEMMMGDHLMDMIAGILPAELIYRILIKLMCQRDEFSLMISAVLQNEWIYLIQAVVMFVFLHFLSEICESTWMEKNFFINGKSSLSR